MLQATPSTNARDGARIFSRKGSIFGGGSSRSTTTRPCTSNGSTSTDSYGSYGDSVGSQESIALSASSAPPRKPSFSFASRPPQSSYTTRTPSIAVSNYTSSPEKRGNSLDIGARPQLPSSNIVSQFPSPQVHRSSDRDSITSTTPYSNMLATSFNKELKAGQSFHAANFAVAGMIPNAPQSPTMENITYQHIQEMASKRISTLDYLRKAHEGRVYWFNTLLFNKLDLARMPYFDTRRLGRRATNYLLLGISLPAILDLNSSTPLDFLRTLNLLLAEFETFQQIHPPDGSASSSLSRARLPQMFKRTTTSSKARRTSSAADIGLPMGNDSYDVKSVTGTISSVASSSATSFPSGDNDLLPGEEYSYLLTPSLPFDPDFYETFATLCDVLIDCYTKLMSLVASPKDCGPHIAEMFTKADARIRKIIVHGVVKEFEESSRSGVKSEVAGVGKVVLGGLM